MIKIQGLAVIAVMVLLPMILVLSGYIDSQAKTLSLQADYDHKLTTTTYDALKAFQLNTSNSDSSDIANSKIRDVEAGANSFFNSLKTNFDLPGYDKDVLGDYVPALVFTMYDGYYIYSPYDNELDRNNVEENGRNGDEKSDAEVLTDSGLTYYQGQRLKGLKPYVYYSARYKRGNLDVVITYSLDNYITVKGKDNSDKAIDIAGYLMSLGDNKVSSAGTYRGVSIPSNENIVENVYISGLKNSSGSDIEGFYQLPCRQINGDRKYALESSSLVISLLNGRWQIENSFGFNPSQESIEAQKNTVRMADVTANTNARQYFIDSENFVKELKNYGIDDLTAGDIVDEDLTNDEKVKLFGSGNIKIFEGLGDSDSGVGTNKVSIEEPGSNFNEHRLAVIKYSIEKNLKNAINNFNMYSTSDYKFEMPKLQENEWNLIYNNICIISFMQGLSIGGRIYSGHSVVPNNNNKEVVADNSIQIVAANSSGQIQVYEPTYKGFEDGTINNANIIRGASRNTLSRVATENLSTGEMHYYYRFARSSGMVNPESLNLAWSSYDSTINSVNNNSNYQKNGTEYGNIYDYINASSSGNLKIAYFTALARERKGMYRVENKSFVTEHATDSQ